MLIVNTLGKFQVMNENGVITEASIRSAMLSKLLVYMIVHRDHPLTIEELSGALWQEDETDNPPGALKNLMYRLRNLLSKELGGEDFVLTSRGSYRWNPAVEISLDIEQFEILVDKAKEDTGLTIEERIRSYEKAIDICQGDFMPKIMDMHWVVTLSTYYHSLFLSAMKDLAELYLDNGQYEEMENACIQALKIDNVDETLHYYLILSRLKNKKLKLALESYEKASDILYKELGIRNSKKLEEVHELILSTNISTISEKIEDIHDDMVEDNPEGVFFVAYPVFREIYRLEVRKTSRVGIAEYVLMLTIANENDKPEEKLTTLDREKINESMVALREVLKSSLRLGDVATKYSESQFLVLLPNCSYESSLLVANRIISKFYSNNRKFKNMKIKMNVDEVSVAKKYVR